MEIFKFFFIYIFFFKFSILLVGVEVVLRGVGWQWELMTTLPLCELIPKEREKAKARIRLG